MTERPRPPWLEKLRDPHWRWLRVPLGATLIVGGIFGILPLVGFWMIPVGLSVLALDFPAAERASDWIRRKSRGAAGWLRRRGLLRRDKSE